MMPHVIAQRADQFLIQTGSQQGRILDGRGLHPEMFLPSLVARGYWEPVDLTMVEAEQALQRRGVLKWEEAQHPRATDGKFTHAPGFKPEWGNPEDYVHVYRGVTDTKHWQSREKGSAIWFSPSPVAAAAYAGAENEGWVIAGYVPKKLLTQGTQSKDYFSLPAKHARKFKQTVTVPAASFTKAQPSSDKDVSRWLKVRGQSIARRLTREETGEADRIRAAWQQRASRVLKWEERQHPRDTDGQFTGKGKGQIVLTDEIRRSAEFQTLTQTYGDHRWPHAAAALTAFEAKHGEEAARAAVKQLRSADVFYGFKDSWTYNQLKGLPKGARRKAVLLKWEETQHPRDAGGKFTEAGLAALKATTWYHGSTTTGLTAFSNAKVRGTDYDAPYTGVWLSTNEMTSPAMVNPTALYQVEPTQLRKVITRPEATRFARQLRRDPAYLTKVAASGAKGEGDYVRLKLLDAGYDAVLHRDKPVINTEELERTGSTKFLLDWVPSELRKEPLFPKDPHSPMSYDLYQHGEHITGYESPQELIDQSDRELVVLDARHAKITQSLPSPWQRATTILKWEESQHPRAEDGQFIGFHGSPEQDITALNPEERHDRPRKGDSSVMGTFLALSPFAAKHYATTTGRIYEVGVQGRLATISQQEFQDQGSAADFRALRDRLKTQGFVGARIPHLNEVVVWQREAMTIRKWEVVSQPVGIGGVTQKFDESLHPRGEDGRFIEATQPRVFRTPEDVQAITNWGQPQYQWRKNPGQLVTGTPLTKAALPDTLYHVTTAGPAVESSGVLLGQRGDKGLGGGQEEGVSFTTDAMDARVIQRELKRQVEVAKGTVDIDAITRWAREDEKEAGLPEGALNNAVTFALDQWEGNRHSREHTFVWDDKLPEEQRGWVGPQSPEESEQKRRSGLNDAFKAYLQLRDHSDVPLLKNPVLFGRQEHLAKVNPDHIQILAVPSVQIPDSALVTTGSDKFLHEVRVYSDVPMRRKTAETTVLKWNAGLHPRVPKGQGDPSGEFTKAGTTGSQTKASSTKRPTPIKVEKISDAIPLILAGKAVELSSVRKVNTLIGRLAEMAKDAKKKGEQAPNYDLCLAGETGVITWDGIQPIASLVGQYSKLLTRGLNGPKWVDAKVSSFGIQPLRKITFTRSGYKKVVFATPNHRWIVRGTGGGFYKQYEVTTDELTGQMRIPSLYGKRVFTKWSAHTGISPSPFGIVHGIVFGDGTAPTLTEKQNYSGFITLYGQKDAQLLKWFPQASRTSVHVEPGEHGYNVRGLKVNEIPRYFKKSPLELGDVSQSYLFGWLAGYFAADGCVSDKGSPMLHSANKENLEMARLVAIRLGFPTYAIGSAMRLGKGKKPSAIYVLRFQTGSLPDDFFLIQEHQKRAGKYDTEKNRGSWRVLSV
ncbi:MAG: hypothetical protein C5B54_12540, partial [Acidobacteria bacterium]